MGHEALALDDTAQLGLIRRILCAVDFSACSARALHLALVMAEKFDATVDVLHVQSVSENEDIDDLEGTVLAGKSMKDFLAGLRLQGHSRLTAQFDRGEAAEKIVEFSRERNHQLIVMGTQGRRGLERLLLGSVAETVVRHSDVPVLTVRLPQIALP